MATTAKRVKPKAKPAKKPLKKIKEAASSRFKEAIRQPAPKPAPKATKQVYSAKAPPAFRAAAELEARTPITVKIDLDQLEAIDRLNKDLRGAGTLLKRTEARFLVDQYYSLQKYRINTDKQVNAASLDQEPNSCVAWIADSMRKLEANMKTVLGLFAARYNVGLWMQSITGIGPVISAGYLAHLDIRRAKTVGHFWRFAGLDPTVKWLPKTKRPWNASLKVLCFKTGESFVKVKNNPNDYYGDIYTSRKEWEAGQNELKKYREQAEAAAKRVGKATEAYKYYSKGLLPPGHLHARARRYAVKLFLSHLHHVMYLDYYGTEPPVPYSFEHGDGDHRHYRPPDRLESLTGGEKLGVLLDG